MYTSTPVLRPVPPERRLHSADVRRIARITPQMMRITIGGSSLIGFPVKRPAQWVKLFVPVAGSERPGGRAYTIRRFDSHTAEMDIDIVLHEGGACASWARQARIGDIVQIAGPRSGFRLHPMTTHLLIGGDETALPAIAGIIETLPPGIAVQAFIEVADPAEMQDIRHSAKVEITWLPRNGVAAGTATALQQAMIAADLPEPGGEVWIAAEATPARLVRRHFKIDRALDRERITASGYWKRGESDFRDAEGDQ
jgi:NADPH-dependent ferric siderophore reductase